MENLELYATNYYRFWLAADNISLWYEESIAFCNRLARIYDISPKVVAAVVAIISPTTRWDRNALSAHAIIDQWAGRDNFTDAPIFGCGQFVAKARKMLDDDHANHVSYVTGPKVTEFYSALTGNKTAVTIDGWMASIAHGEKLKWDSHYPDKIEVYQDALLIAADAADINPRDFQATIWEYAKKHYSGKRHGTKMLP